MNPPPLIFDFGGVLVDWNPRHLYRKLFDGDTAAMEQFLAEVHFTEWNIAQDRGRNFAEGVEALCAQFPQHASLIRAYDERWEESIPGPLQPTIDLLQPLRQKGCPLYGLTNSSAEKFAIARKKYPFLGWFDYIMVSGEVKIVKPDPRIYLALLEKIGRPPAECVFIDDSTVNTLAASQLGFQTIHFQSPAQLKAELIRLEIL